MAETARLPFGKWRTILWPIYWDELPRLLPMMAVIFIICFDYSILRNLKDTVVVTAKCSGAEVIPFLKVWVVFPAAVGMTLLYTYLSSRVSQERVFYLIVSGFLAYYLLFSFVLYPLRDTLHPEGAANFLQSWLPEGAKGLVAMFRNWTFTIFYVLCEMWGCMVLSVLFWGIANQVTLVEQAKRFYGIFTLAGNLAAILAGKMGVWASEPFLQTMASGQDEWERTLRILIVIVAFSGVLMLMIFRGLNLFVFRKCAVCNSNPGVSGHNSSKPPLKKRSLMESIIYLSRSRYLIYIAVMVVSYNLVINLAEVFFKDRLKQFAPSPYDYNVYMNELTTLWGIISSIFAIPISFLLLRSWKGTALITPVLMLVTGLAFFGCLFMPMELAFGLAAMAGTTPLGLTALCGGLQNCFSKAAKYSVFDASKEMAFTPLEKESKIKGKAAIDGVGSRLGKMGGSLFLQCMLILCGGSLMASAPFVALLLLVVCLLWIFCVNRLGNEFEERSRKQPYAVSTPMDAPTQAIQEPLPTT
jgi:AAA family ATP:ADP antiporter